MKYFLLVLFSIMFNNVFGQDLKDNDLSEGITGRKVLNAPSVDSKDTSKVAIKICVNQGGVVTYAEIIPRETTLKPKLRIRNLFRINIASYMLLYSFFRPHRS